MKNTILALLAISLLPLAARASEGVLSLSPAVVMLRGDFGQSTTQLLTVRNNTTHAFSFDLVAQDVIVRDGKRVFVEAGTTAGSIAATAVFSPKHIEIAPGQNATARITVTLPRDTQQRAVVALFHGTNTILNGRVPMTASLGTLLTFTASEDVALTATQFRPRTQSTATNVGVAGTCTNTGREPLVAKGVLAVLDARGTLVGKSEMRPQRLMPGESATIDSEYGGALDPGRYRLFVTWDYEGRSLSRSAEVEVR